MTSDIAFLLSAICSGLIIILTAIDYIINKKAYAIIKVKGTGIVIIILIGLMIFFSGWQRKIEKRASEISDSTNLSYQRKIDSLRSEQRLAKEQHQDSLIKYSEKHSKEIEATTLSLTTSFIIGTKTVIESAQRDAEKLRDTIDILQERLLPNITHALSKDPINTLQSNDTFYVFLRIRNGGGSVAKNLTFESFYLCLRNNIIYEYWSSFCSAINMELSPNETWTFLKSNECAMFNFIFKPQEMNQYLLVIGSYSNDNENKKVVKDFSLCYKWNNVNNTWSISTNRDYFVEAHRLKKVVYFKSNIE